MPSLCQNDEGFFMPNRKIFSLCDNYHCTPKGKPLSLHHINNRND